jgi:ribonuclease HI
VIHASLHTDGGARPTNPGPAGIAAVVMLAGKYHTLARPLGWKTNNQAEFLAMVVGIKYAAHLGAQQLDIYSDSKLVVNTVNEEWTTTNHELRILKTEIQVLLRKHFENNWTLTWISRDRNMIADAACTKAIRYNNPWIPTWCNPLDPFVKRTQSKGNRNPYALK